MAYSGSGMGGILLLETMLVPGGKGRLVLTGSLGDVIKESAELGLTWVKSRAVALGITSHRSQDPLKNVDIHVSVPPLSPGIMLISASFPQWRSQKGWTVCWYGHHTGLRQSLDWSLSPVYSGCHGRDHAQRGSVSYSFPMFL